MKIKLFNYGYLIRHAFDLGRIFPIIIKQRGVSKIVAGIGSHIIEAPHSIWIYVLTIDLQMRTTMSGLIPGRINEVWMTYLSSMRLETTIQSILG